MGIDFDFLQLCQTRKLNDNPIMTRTPLASGFPAFAHMHGPSGVNQIVLLPKIHVVRGNHNAARVSRRHINKALQFTFGRTDFSVHSQSRDSTIWNIKPMAPMSSNCETAA